MIKPLATPLGLRLCCAHKTKAVFNIVFLLSLRSNRYFRYNMDKLILREVLIMVSGRL